MSLQSILIIGLVLAAHKAAGCSQQTRLDQVALVSPLWLADGTFHQDSLDHERRLRGPCDEQSLDPPPGSADRRRPPVGADSLIRSGGVLRRCPGEPEPVALVSLSSACGPAQPGSRGSAPLQAWPSSIARPDLPVISVTKESPLRAPPRWERHVVVPEGIPVSVVFREARTISGFDLCDLTRCCFYYMLFAPSVSLSKGNVVRALFHLWWCARGRMKIVV
jgi:hypothetical protein